MNCAAQLIYFYIALKRRPISLLSSLLDYIEENPAIEEQKSHRNEFLDIWHQLSLDSFLQIVEEVKYFVFQNQSTVETALIEEKFTVWSLLA